MKGKKIFEKPKDFPSFRLSLNYCCSILNYPAEIYNNKDPILNLLNNSENKDNKDNKDNKVNENIKYIISHSQKEKITKYYYFNITAIHAYLYLKEKVIKITYDPNINNLEFNFYLILLISEDKNVLNYEYDEDYINKLNEENNNNKNKLNQLIKSKLIVDLTNEYILDNDIEDEDPKLKKLNDIINTNKESIKNNLNILMDLNIQLNIEDILELPIDKIYIIIIIGLIQSKKFGDYDFVIDIINQLSLDEIDLTKLMYDELKSFLDDENKKNLLNDYIIKEEKDLNDDIKINFNYILIKYILKNIFDLYNIKFVFDLRNNLKNILKKNRKAINNCEKSKYLKIKYILNSLSLQPKKFVKNNIKKYYDNFLSGNINKIIEKTTEINHVHDDLDIIEYLKQIYDVKEYREEYKKNANKIEENENILKILLDKLAGLENAENDSYAQRLQKILKNEEIKNSLISGKDLSDDILKKLFVFKSIEDDKRLQEVENKIDLLEGEQKLEVNKEAINIFENWLNKNEDKKDDKDDKEDKEDKDDYNNDMNIEE